MRALSGARGEGREQGRRDHMRKYLLLGALMLTALFVASTAASASRITKGDAQAVFQGHPGGIAIRAHGGTLEGAPAAGNAAAGVRINAFTQWDGRHYCSLDWHVIAIFLFDGNAPGESRTPQEIATALSAMQVEYSVDGTPLDTTRTPVKPNSDAGALGFTDSFFFAAGRVMAPADLSVGAHTLGIVISDPGGIIDTSQITFFVDPSGTGACL
jgi:hypothetical protein